MQAILEGSPTGGRLAPKLNLTLLQPLVKLGGNDDYDNNNNNNDNDNNNNNNNNNNNPGLGGLVFTHVSSIMRNVIV